MTDALLTDPKFVKSMTSISDNLSGKYMMSSIREAQDVALRGIIGSALLEKLKKLVKNGTIHYIENSDYQQLLDECQYFLAYSAIIEIIRKTSYKVGNFGLTKTQDENLSVASDGEIGQTEFYYQSKADSCCLDLQNYILENRTKYPELTESVCHKISANLHSAASCGIFLGGARGKGINHKCCKR